MDRSHGAGKSTIRLQRSRQPKPVELHNRERDLNQACRMPKYLMWCALPDGFEQNSVKEDKASLGPTPTVGIGTSASGNPSILVMDEATSALDAESEQRIIRNLSRRGCTHIVAHRLSTIRDADLILVMDQGQVIEQGKHRSHRNDHGAYTTSERSSRIGDITAEQIFSRNDSTPKPYPQSIIQISLI